MKVFFVFIITKVGNVNSVINKFVELRVKTSDFHIQATKIFVTINGFISKVKKMLMMH